MGLDAETQKDTTLDNDKEEGNLWEKILSEASRSVSDRLESKNIIVLGMWQMSKLNYLRILFNWK